MDLQVLMGIPILNNGKLNPIHVVDITENGKPVTARRVVLRYALTSEGVLVQVAHVGERFCGVGSNFFLDAVDEQAVRRVAERVSMNPAALVKAIADNVPKEKEQVQQA